MTLSAGGSRRVSGPSETRPVGRGTGTGRCGLTGAFQQQVPKRRVSTGAPGLGNPAPGNLVNGRAACLHGGHADTVNDSEAAEAGAWNEPTRVSTAVTVWRLTVRTRRLLF